jgi:hypothetical protein
MANEKEAKQRTLQQNRALHLLFGMIAQTLNENGLDMRRTLKDTIDIPWNAETVKEYMWRPIQKAQLNKESTTELTTKDIDAVFDTLTRYLGEKHGVYTPFPSVDEIIQNQLDRKRVA